MEKKNRIFYLDFVRAFATFMILLTHYNALFVFNYPMSIDKVVGTYNVFNIYIGNFGVSLFFIISGASLMYIYGDKINIKMFYIKRFKSLYPMFWIAYFIFFLVQFYIGRGIDSNIPKWHIIFSILGMDGYMQSLGIPISTFYILGEWFLGCIVFLYFIFPLLRIGIKKMPVVTCICSIALYIVGTVLYKGNISESVFWTNRIPEMLFGMIFVTKNKNVKWPVALGALLILIVNTISNNTIDAMIQTTYVGILSFIVIVYLCQLLEKIPNKAFKEVVSFFSKYSYAIFLVHHVIIYDIVRRFDLSTITRTNSYILFILCLVVICAAAVLLTKINNIVLKKICAIMD